MAVPEVISKLIERFEILRSSYIHGDEYNETKLRQDYLDHFFIALGWDVYNKQGWSEQAREVSVEQPIKIAGTTDFIDYSFKIGRDLMFIAEAKAPKVRIKDNLKAAHQVRGYAWNAKLPLCILTNFDEFAIYDCTKKPSSSDPAGYARIEYFTFKDLPVKWDEIVKRFSKDAVFNGSFDAFAKTTKGKKGTASVDEAFLTEIEGWRESLAKNIMLRNRDPPPNVDELNYAVQVIIDRIIFLQNCEDRGLEHYGTLKSILDSDNTYAHLCELFKKADKKYNSGIFYFEKEFDREEPDLITPGLKIDDNVLKPIIRELSEGPYEFSVIPPEILGHVYEQFLGKVIRITEGSNAKVDDKPEVKKAGGVFYTPQYIVEYIVKHTVRELIEGKTPREVAKLHILDPACGSGSFLIGAYQCLLDWHLEWYIKNIVPLLNQNVPITDSRIQSLLPEPLPRKKKLQNSAELPIYRTSYSNGVKLLDRTRSDWALSTSEKKRILIKNIFGVDIDRQAVEVTKLSLLLKVLEDEKEENLDKQLKISEERALPSLDKNIKCGNSLIGTDISTPEMSPEEFKRINLFDWEKGFPDVMKAGGFDAVIGNPPWGADFSENELKYLRENYSEVIDRMIDSYIYFILLAIRIVKRKNPIGVIIPSTILNQVDTTSVRKIILNRGLSDLISLGQGIFTKKVLNTSSILISKPLDSVDVFNLSDLSGIALEEKSISLNSTTEKCDWKKWTELVKKDPHYTFFVNKIDKTKLLDRLREQHLSLETIIEGAIQRGVSPDVKEAHIVSVNDAKKIGLEKDLLRKSISGPQIKRYQPWKSDQLIIYTSKTTKIRDYPITEDYLKKFKDLNSCQEVIEGNHPYWALHRPRNPDIFKSPKFIGLTTSKTIEIIYDENSSLFVTDAMYVFTIKEKINPWVLMAILHSKLFLFLYRVANQGESRVIPQVKASKLNSLPIPKSSMSDNASITSLSQHAVKMLDLNKRMQDAKLDQDKTLLQRQIEVTDASIDTLVYELYGLTEEEIAIVEGTV